MEAAEAEPATTAAKIRLKSIAMILTSLSDEIRKMGKVIATDFPGLSECACETRAKEKRSAIKELMDWRWRSDVVQRRATHLISDCVRAVADLSRTTCQGRRRCKPRSAQGHQEQSHQHGPSESTFSA